MMTMLLALHIAGGSAALLSMFVPILARKGGAAHRRAGWVFVTGMAIVSVTALLLSGARFFFDPRPEVKIGTLFLFYIAILPAAGVSTGVRVLRVRHVASGSSRKPRPSWWDLGISSLLLATSVGMAAFGLVTNTPLLIAFSVIGFLLSRLQRVQIFRHQRLLRSLVRPRVLGELCAFDVGEGHLRA